MAGGQRPRPRARTITGDAARGRRLYELLKGEWFWCEICRGVHPLAEHRNCREGS